MLKCTFRVPTWDSLFHVSSTVFQAILCLRERTPLPRPRSLVGGRVMNTVVGLYALAVRGLKGGHLGFDAAFMPNNIYCSCQPQRPQTVKVEVAKNAAIHKESITPQVDGNEKRGGSARRPSSLISLGLWRSRVVFNLNMSFPCKTLYFRFRPFQQN